MAVNSSISLTDEQHRFAKKLVEAGCYSSVSAVLQQGIDLLRQRMQVDDLHRSGAESAAGPARCRYVCQRRPDGQDHRAHYD